MMLSLDRITESSFHSLFIMAGDCGRIAEKYHLIYFTKNVITEIIINCSKYRIIGGQGI
jgi:hypothetical protein